MSKKPSGSAGRANGPHSLTNGEEGSPMAASTIPYTNGSGHIPKVETFWFKVRRHALAIIAVSIVVFQGGEFLIETGWFTIDKPAKASDVEKLTAKLETVRSDLSLLKIEHVKLASSLTDIAKDVAILVDRTQRTVVASPPPRRSQPKQARAQTSLAAPPSSR